MPRLAGGKDIITQPLYDTQKYDTTPPGTLTFFGTPKGQGTTLFGTGTKNLSDTNMEAAASLPSPWTFEIHTIQVDVFQLANTATQITDVEGLLSSGNLELNIGSKWWLRAPIRHTPAGAGMTGVFGTAVGGVPLMAGAFVNGTADPRAVFILSRPITILEQESFNVVLGWPNSFDVTAACMVRVYLGGELSRAIQ